jgi:tetratricopeptide (TPR) repeat protein
MKPSVQAYAEIERLLSEVRARKARQLEQEQSRETIRKNIAAAHEFVSRQEWDNALSVVNKALSMRPACAEYIEEAKNIQQLRVRDRELSAVEAALARGNLDQAIHTAEAALAKYPAEPRAVAVLQSARVERSCSLCPPAPQEW